MKARRIMRYGLMNELYLYPEAQQRVNKSLCYHLTQVFKRNAELLKIIDKTLKTQLTEIRDIYGMSLSNSLMSELKGGKRFKTGIILLGTLKDYWLQRGYEFKIIL